MGLIQYIISERVSSAKEEALEERFSKKYIRYINDIKNSRDISLFDYMEKNSEKHNMSMKEAINEYFSPLNFKDIVNKLLEADPTKNKKYGNWLVDNIFGLMEEKRAHSFWELEGLIKEDSGKIKRNLKIFTILKDRNKLSGQEADINQYDFDELFEKVKPYLDDPEYLGTRKENVMSETEILYDDNGWKVVKPLSYESSCFWGTATNWCTAVDDGDSSTFDDYQEDAPLYIFIREKGSEKRKFQLHWSEWELQFMDEEDNHAVRDFYNLISKELFTDMTGLCIYDQMESRDSITEFLFDVDGFTDIIDDSMDKILWSDYIPYQSIDTLVNAYEKYIEHVEKEENSRQKISKFYKNYMEFFDEYVAEDFIEVMINEVGSSLMITVLLNITSISGSDVIKLENEVYKYYEDLKP